LKVAKKRVDLKAPRKEGYSVMTVNRRRLLQSLAFAGGQSTAAASAIELDGLRNVAAAHGTSLSDSRLRIVKPVLERRLPQLQALRNFEIDDRIAPTQGILDK
jgi:hypothetical protein